MIIANLFLFMKLAFSSLGFFAWSYIAIDSRGLMKMYKPFPNFFLFMTFRQSVKIMPGDLNYNFSNEWKVVYVAPQGGVYNPNRSWGKGFFPDIIATASGLTALYRLETLYA